LRIRKIDRLIYYVNACPKEKWVGEDDQSLLGNMRCSKKKEKVQPDKIAVICYGTVVMEMGRGYQFERIESHPESGRDKSVVRVSGGQGGSPSDVNGGSLLRGQPAASRA
jgi:hypothetical protein